MSAGGATKTTALLHGEFQAPVTQHLTPARAGDLGSQWLSSKNIDRILPLAYVCADAEHRTLATFHLRGTSVQPGPTRMLRYLSLLVVTLVAVDAAAQSVELPAAELAD